MKKISSHPHWHNIMWEIYHDMRLSGNRHNHWFRSRLGAVSLMSPSHNSKQGLITKIFHCQTEASTGLIKDVVTLGNNPWTELTRTTRTPAFWGYPPPPHDYPYHWVILDPKSKEDKVKVTNFKNSPKFQVFEFWNRHYTWHIFLSCLIRCANMKWIRWVLLKIQSGHDSVHRWTDGQGDTSIPPYQLRWSGGYN